MKSKFFNVMNHQLTDEQREVVDGAGFEIIELPEDLKARWGGIPPDANNEFIMSLVCDVVTFLKSHELGLINVALVQGEPVVSFNLAQFLQYPGSTKGRLIVPVVATTRRESVEEPQPDDSVKKLTVFRHVSFRPYHLVHWGMLRAVGLGGEEVLPERKLEAISEDRQDSRRPL